jgi:hypothetical protein
LREERRLKVFENMVLRRIFGEKRGEERGGWSANGNKKIAYRVLMWKSEGKKPVERPRRRWVDNIKVHLRGIEWGGMGWTDLAQDRGQWWVLSSIIMKLRVP